MRVFVKRIGEGRDSSIIGSGVFGSGGSSSGGFGSGGECDETERITKKSTPRR